MGDGREDRTVESKAAKKERLRKMSKRDRKVSSTKFYFSSME